MEGQFFEHDDRLILVRGDGAQGWAWPGGYDGAWRPVAATFAGAVFFEGKKITAADAAKRYGIDLDQLPK